MESRKATRLLLVVCVALMAVPLPLLADDDSDSDSDGPSSLTVKVNCNKGKSIQRALGRSADQLTVKIKGMCQERVVITRHNVTLIGSDPATDGITGPAVDDVVVQRALVRIIDSRNVRLENLTITASDSRGLEATELTFVDVVNCRITGNAGRGLQVSSDSFASIVDTTIAFNGSFELIAFEGVANCERCTIDDDGFSVVAASGARISFLDSWITTSGDIAVNADLAAFVSGRNTDVTSGFITLWTNRGSRLFWRDSTLSGSFWADTDSQLAVVGTTQTANLVRNIAFQDSHVEIRGGTLVGDTQLTGFSNGTAEGAPTLGTVTCDRGGDLYCDGSETKGGSSCGLCP